MQTQLSSCKEVIKTGQHKSFYSFKNIFSYETCDRSNSISKNSSGYFKDTSFSSASETNKKEIKAPKVTSLNSIKTIPKYQRKPLKLNTENMTVFKEVKTIIYSKFSSLKK